MPRIVFDSFEELKKWCDEFIKEKSHTIYTTENDELIVEPRRSTRPSRYGYFKSIKVKEFAKTLSEKHEIPYFHLKSYEWDTEKSPGIKMSPK